MESVAESIDEDQSLKVIGDRGEALRRSSFENVDDLRKLQDCRTTNDSETGKLREREGQAAWVREEVVSHEEGIKTVFAEYTIDCWLLFLIVLS